MKSIHKNWNDSSGAPDGGVSTGIGFTISWQRGPCPLQPDGTQPDRNGAFLIEVLEACEAQLIHYQSGKFNCHENADALDNVGRALKALRSRLNRRADGGKLGTHKPD